MDRPKSRSKPKRRGRPPLPKTQGKRHAIGLRVTADLRGQLESGAQASGRSLSQEAEFRLEQSFKSEEALGGSELAGLFRMMAGAAQLIEVRRGGKSWATEWETFRAVKQAWETLIEAAGPGRAPPAIRDDVMALVASKPMPPDPFTEDSPTVAAEQEEYETKLNAHRTQVADYERRLAEYQERLVTMARRFEELANMGSEAAASLLLGQRASM